MEIVPAGFSVSQSVRQPVMDGQDINGAAWHAEQDIAKHGASAGRSRHRGPRATKPATQTNRTRRHFAWPNRGPRQPATAAAHARRARLAGTGPGDEASWQLRPGGWFCGEEACKSGAATRGPCAPVDRLAPGARNAIACVPTASAPMPIRLRLVVRTARTRTDALPSFPPVLVASCRRSVPCLSTGRSSASRGARRGCCRAVPTAEDAVVWLARCGGKAVRGPHPDVRLLGLWFCGQKGRHGAMQSCRVVLLQLLSGPGYTYGGRSVIGAVCVPNADTIFTGIPRRQVAASLCSGGMHGGCRRDD